MKPSTRAVEPQHPHPHLDGVANS